VPLVLSIDDAWNLALSFRKFYPSLPLDALVTFPLPFLLSLFRATIPTRSSPCSSFLINHLIGNPINHSPQRSIISSDTRSLLHACSLMPRQPPFSSSSAVYGRREGVRLHIGTCLLMSVHSPCPRLLDNRVASVIIVVVRPVWSSNVVHALSRLPLQTLCPSCMTSLIVPRTIVHDVSTTQIQ